MRSRAVRRVHDLLRSSSGVVIIAYYLLTHCRWCLCCSESDDVVMAKPNTISFAAHGSDRGARKMHSENHVLAWGASSAIIFIASRSVDIGKLC